ncbi:hypothetical protein H1235_04590 [Pseudoxanthomonas sp. NC8]|nr:hypothetical protein H1235_04590 [Pseudoxanthomonas sp. NC8]
MPSRRARAHGWPAAGDGLTVAVFTGTASALPQDKAFRDYVSDTWGVEHGLPQISVLAITQDRDGYLWLGSQGGLTATTACASPATGSRTRRGWAVMSWPCMPAAMAGCGSAPRGACCCIGMAISAKCRWPAGRTRRRARFRYARSSAMATECWWQALPGSMRAMARSCRCATRLAVRH